MLLSHPPSLIKSMYPSLLWKVDTDKPEIFLTFDDGPTPGVTELVLNKLSDYGAKATFFCLGKNVKENPELFERIKAEGHSVGNHTFDHLNGWKSKTDDYIESIRKCESVFSSHLFRPPYGRIKPSQIKFLKEKYKIVMWSALSMDYDPMVSSEKSIEISLKDLTSGSIIVLHDSLKAKAKMLEILEELLKHCKSNEINCSAINEER
jgi:peptidoglycan/xylan/chitin deacetylase (PgdA/CDA1 family)